MTQDTTPQEPLTGTAERTPSLTNGVVIPANKVSGTSVYNTAGDHLGHIDDIMVDKLSGRVAFALMAFGGFLGIGERFHPLPWSVLTYDEDLGGYRVDLDRDTLEKGPHYDFGENLAWDDPDWRAGVYDHYGARHYWI